MSENLRKTSYALDDVRRISVPLLMIVGADDKTFPPVMIRSVAALIKDALVAVLPAAGHSPYCETPEAWNEVVMKFLGR